MRAPECPRAPLPAAPWCQALFPCLQELPKASQTTERSNKSRSDTSQGALPVLSSVVTPCRAFITFLPEEAPYNFHNLPPVLALTMTRSSLAPLFSSWNLCNSETPLKTSFLYKGFQMYYAPFSPFLGVFCYKILCLKKSQRHRIDVIKFSAYCKVPVSVLFICIFLLLEVPILGPISCFPFGTHSYLFNERPLMSVQCYYVSGVYVTDILQQILYFLLLFKSKIKLLRSVHAAIFKIVNYFDYCIVFR